MLKKISCLMIALALILVSFSACSKPQVETIKVAKADSVVNFALYKKDVIALLDDAKVNYDFSEFFVGDEKDAPEASPYFYIMKIVLKDEPGREISIGFSNDAQIESFTASITVPQPTIGDCDLNIRDYSYLRKIFNLVSEIEVSAFDCNRLMRSTRKGSKEQYESNTDAFYKKKERFFSQDKTETWALQYSIYYNTTADPVVFEETLAYKGNLAPRVAA